MRDTTPDSAKPYVPNAGERAVVYTAIERLPHPVDVIGLAREIGPELTRWALAKKYIPDDGHDWTVPLLLEECRV